MAGALLNSHPEPGVGAAPAQVADRAFLEPQGRWDACRERLVELYDPSADPEYLVVTGRKEG